MAHSGPHTVRLWVLGVLEKDGECGPGVLLLLGLNFVGSLCIGYLKHKKGN